MTYQVVKENGRDDVLNDVSNVYGSQTLSKFLVKISDDENMTSNQEQNQ